MSRLMAVGAIIALFAGPALAADPMKTLVCPGVVPGTAYEACPSQRCLVPAADTDMVLTQVGGVRSWQRLATVPPTGPMFQCGVQPVGWTTRQLLNLAVSPPQVVLYPYTVTWDAPTLNVDGTPIADLKAYRVENSGGSPDGPWAPLTVPKESLSAVFKLPSSIRQCFRVFAVTAVDSQPSEVVCREAVAREAKPPTNLRATVGDQPASP